MSGGASALVVLTVPAADAAHASRARPGRPRPAAHANSPSVARVLLLDPGSADATDVAVALTATGADVRRVALGGGF
ncbi:hypothetical protein LV779_39180 [Streptomyces thinghirensis]|nr:hypothetical protein [Streptomyces thinghirensis]